MISADAAAQSPLLNAVVPALPCGDIPEKVALFTVPAG